ncbi:hypothetical protein SEA_SHAM_217 [Streptomyces phage Sham]|nr:hypothetical protein SEA_SHAM_217 [Streptomyces phage Sham]
MDKKWILGIIGAGITVVVLAIIVATSMVTPETKFERYQRYADDVHVVDWTISEDTAKSFADANCDKLAEGKMPSLRFKNEDHVKSSGAVIAAYCPESFDNFLAGLVMKHPEYVDTAKYMIDEIKVF